jgi:hypothetical protein
MFVCLFVCLFLFVCSFSVCFVIIINTVFMKDSK